MIFFVAENLHTDKKDGDEEEGEGEEGEKEEVALGREKMTRIQSMFSGEKKLVGEEGVISSPSCTDFNELMDEGLISGLMNFHHLRLRSSVSESAPFHKWQPEKNKSGFRHTTTHLDGHSPYRQEAHRGGSFKV